MKKAAGIGVTIYALFGEQGTAEDPEFIHIEDIKSRSRLYEWRISAHAHHRMFQIVYIVSGAVAMRIEGKTAKAKGPCAITIPPGAVHSFSFQPDTIGYVLTSADTLLLDTRYMRSRPLIDPLLSQPKTVDFSTSPEAASFVQNLMAATMREFAQAQPGRSSMLDWLLHSIVLTLARQVAMGQSMGGRRGYARETFASFLKLVEDHYRKHINVSDYADMLAMSSARLNRLCRTFAGKPAQEIIHARLVLEAQRLLTYTSATSAQVAYELGFQDPAYFTRFFKRQTGETPNTFRQTE
jgi:AraC family transcriptional regulator, transcriptional activator of pobA